MFSEAALVIVHLASGSANSPGGSGTVVAALIAGAVAIITASIAAYAGTRGDRVGRLTPDLTQQLADAVHDAAIADNKAHDAEVQLAVERSARRDAETEVTRLEGRVIAYERALVLRGFVPWRFITGEESDDDAHVSQARR